jgi:peptide/nickel transport system ATP-binding protein
VNLTIKNLSVTYASNEHMLLALDRVSLELTPGKVTALVGESGSGKTTLGKTVMGLLPDYARVKGSVTLDSLELLSLPAPEMNHIRWSRISMLFQNGAESMNPVHRILDQVAEPLIQKQGFSRKDAAFQAQKSLEQMELDPGLGSRYPHQVSGGEIQRCLLAMALIMNPEIIILDEPTASLDALNKALIRRVILGAKNKGQAVLVITHDLDLARSTADEAVVLYLSQVMEVLPAGELFLAPKHPYTMALARSYPALDTRRDLGGIRGDAFYRIVHRHRESNGGIRHHSHLIGPDQEHEHYHESPGGCLFVDRCTQAIPECREKEIAIQKMDGHELRCIRGGIATLLRMTSISKSYAGKTALYPVSLELKAGETFCLVGESGSGKTTLAMIGAALLEQDSGSWIYNQRDMDQWIRQDYLSLARQIGLVHQHPAQAVSHRFSVFEIVSEPLRIQGYYSRQEIQEKVLSALKDVRLSTEPEFLRRYPHELNMGALQRICIARALVTGPSLLIADEPTSSLDPSVQAKVLKMILDLQIEKGLTMLFVTHDIGLAGKIADRMGVMLAGRMVEIGPAAQILNKSAHPYTRLLMNGSGSQVHDGPVSLTPGPDIGCPFVPRCGRKRDLCAGDNPETRQTGQGNHFVRCHFPLN